MRLAAELSSDPCTLKRVLAGGMRFRFRGSCVPVKVTGYAPDLRWLDVQDRWGNEFRTRLEELEPIPDELETPWF